MANFDYLGDLFSPEELNAYQHVFPDGVNIAALQKLGNVEVVESEKDDVITKTITFESFDGQTTFVKEKSYYKYKIGEERIKELRRLMFLAADEDTVDGYKRAAKIKNQIEELKITE